MPLVENISHALRMMRRNPGFSFLVILILALGIAANTAMFTLLNAALLRPLPYRDPSHLVFLSAIDRSEGGSGSNGGSIGCLSLPHFQLIASRNRSFSQIAAFTNENFNFTRGSEAVQLQAARVSSNFFDVLGVRPVLGRSFLSSESKPGGNLAAILSDDFWRTHFHQDPNVIGQSITLDSRSYTIVGVLPPGFHFGLLGTNVQVWAPRFDELNLMTAQQVQIGACYLDAVARLAPGISIAQAQAEMNVLDNAYLRERPTLADADPKRPVEVVPLKARLVSGFRSIFFILSTAVAFVLLIACANVASLLLTRGLKRRREFAIRIAMGARRGQLALQLLTETVLLGIVSGILGLGLSLWGTRLMVNVVAGTFPRMTELAASDGSAISIDWRVLAFALVISALTGLLFGLAPALQFSKPEVGAALREEGRGTAGARSRNVSRHFLVAGQVALSLVLLVGAGLLIRSFIWLETQPPGFEPRGVLTMDLALPPSRYAKPDQMIAFYDEVLRRVQALPGVTAAAVSSALPVNITRLTPVLIEGQPKVPLAERPIIIIQMFTPSYLRVMRIPLRKGRFFNPHDKQDSARVLVVNEAFAKRFFPGQDPVGKHILLGRSAAPSEIVGLIGDIKNVSLAIEPEPEIDLPFAQATWAKMNLMLRTEGDPNALAVAVRRAVAQVDPNQPVTAVRTLSEVLSEASAQPRVVLFLVSAFAAFAFLLAIVGLYAVISYSVAQRTQEMGVRIALGSTPAALFRLVLSQAATLAGAGIAIGIVCSLALTRLMTKIVYGVSTLDPLTFLLVPLLFFVFALLASYVPALRATRVDVVDALRE